MRLTQSSGCSCSCASRRGRDRRRPWSTYRAMHMSEYACCHNGRQFCVVRMSCHWLPALRILSACYRRHSKIVTLHILQETIDNTGKRDALEIVYMKFFAYNGCAEGSFHHAVGCVILPAGACVVCSSTPADACYVSAARTGHLVSSQPGRLERMTGTVASAM